MSLSMNLPDSQPTTEPTGGDIQTPRSSALCVDLDGTLIASDVSIEQIVTLARTQPWRLLKLPLWLAKGAAYAKSALGDRVTLDPSSLPYRPEVLALIQQARAEGRPVLLVSASDERAVKQIADHLGCFDGAVGSTAAFNAAGANKVKAIRDILGDRPWDYVGDAHVDGEVWREASGTLLVGSKRSARRAAEAAGHPVQKIKTREQTWRDWLALMRPQQWTKNFLVFLPLLASHRFGAESWLGAAIAFMAFSLCASGVYVLNDLLDMPADRLHSRKKKRPLARGIITARQALVAAPLLMILGLGVGLLTQSPRFEIVLIAYLGLTTMYSVYLKRKLAIDAISLAMLYSLRVLGGGEATGAVASPWLLAFTMFLFVSLAFGKRYSELHELVSEGKLGAQGRGYRIDDMDLIRSFGTTSGYLSVLVFALYTANPSVAQHYSHPWRLWLICPIILYWLTRVWFTAHRGGLQQDPLQYAVRDRVSWLCMALAGIVFIAAT